MLSLLKNLNLALAFLLELAALVAFGYWGFTVGQSTLFKFLLGLGAPALGIVVWALIGAPKAFWPLSVPWHAVLEFVFFGAAALALVAAGQRVLGIAFALIFLLNFVLPYLLGN